VVALALVTTPAVVTAAAGFVVPVDTVVAGAVVSGLVLSSLFLVVFVGVRFMHVT
jgi:hypothetical protein